MKHKIGVRGQARLQCYTLKHPFERLITKVLGFLGLNALKTAYVRKYSVLKWDTGFMKNKITTAGLAQIALLAGDASAVPFTYLEVGTSSTAVSAAHTALQAAITDTGLGRSAATVSRVTTTSTNDSLQLTYTWTATGTKTIEEIGIFNASSGGTMLGRCLNTNTSKTVNDGDQFIGTYKVTFTGN